MVVSDTPLNFTTAPDAKLVPVTIKVLAALPVIAIEGDMLVIVGLAVLVETVNVDEPETCPLGFVTVTKKLPLFEKLEEGSDAVNCVEDTNVVETDEPLNLTVAPETKFVPFTVSVIAELPITADDGEMLDIVGALVELTTVKVIDPETKPLGFVTVTKKLPELAKLEVGIAAVSCVEETNVVETGDPLNLTTAPDAKLLPVTVKVIPELPITADVGDKLEIMGTLELVPTLNVRDPETVASGFNTVIGKLPETARLEAGIEAIN